MDAALISVAKDGLVTFSLKNLERMISGPEEAVQYAACALFTTPGTFLYSRPDGGGILKLIDGSGRTQAEARIEAMLSIRRAMTTINRNQDQGKDPSSRIVGLRLISLEFVGLKIKLRIRIELAIGRSFAVNFQIGTSNAS